MAESKKGNKLLIVGVVVVVLVVGGLLAKNSIAAKIIAGELDKAKGALPSMVEMSVGDVSCSGFGLSTCTISDIILSESGHSMRVGSVSFTENASLISFGMKNFGKAPTEVSGAMQIALDIKGVEFRDTTNSSLLPAINIEKDVEVTLLNGKPQYLKLNRHKITSSFLEADIQTEIKGIQFDGEMPKDATLSYLNIEATNKNLATLLGLVPSELLDDMTRGYVSSLLSGGEEFFLSNAIPFENRVAQDLFKTGNSFTAQKPVSLKITNTSGIGLEAFATKLMTIAPSAEDEELFTFLGENFQISFN